MKKRNRKNKSTRSVRNRIVWPMAALLVVQTLLYSFFLTNGELTNRIDQNAFNSFYTQADNLGLYLENEMIQRWSQLEQTETEIQSIIQGALREKNAEYSAIRTDSQLNESLVSQCAPSIVSTLRRNSTTGAFLILNGPGVDAATAKDNYAAFYVRDNDPATFTAKNSDLLLEAGLPSISKDLEISLDSFWSAVIYKEEVDNRFFQIPMDEAEKSPKSSSANFGYWSEPFSLNPMGDTYVAYTRPLISESGEVYGAIGVDLSLNYLTSRIRMHSGGSEDVSFLLTKGEKEGSHYSFIAVSGNLVQYYYKSQSFLEISEEPLESDYGEISVLKTVENTDTELYGVFRQLKLYNVNTPFEEQTWNVVAVREKQQLLSLTRQIRVLVYSISIATMLVSAIVLIIIVISITRPINILLTELEISNPMQPVTLPKVNIREIDMLAAAVERLSQSVADSASRFSKILERTDILLGVFEYQLDGEVVYCSEKFFDVLNMENERGGDRHLELSTFLNYMNSLEVFEQGDRITTYHVVARDGTERWADVTTLVEGRNCLGVAVDVTDQILERRKIEYERDFDSLTALHNRLAFMQKLETLFSRPEQLRISALVMWDLDNLKYVNDTYGHDAGDEYIINFANILRPLENSHCYLARRSGDEFYLFFYGYDSKMEIMNILAELWEKIEESSFRLPNGNDYKIRASGGIAWYPQDAITIANLVRFSDFAMYSVKHNTKGSIETFDIEEWRKNSILLNSQEAFDRLVDNEMVDFAYQPIFDIRSGEIYGYEALMRSQLLQFTSPQDILRMARSQSRLYAIERLTLYGAVNSFSMLLADKKAPKDCHFFVNSLPNQRLSDKELNELEMLYGRYLSNMVLEITETEAIDSEFLEIKRFMVKEKWKGQIAVDDYGAGYGNASALLNVAPDIVKVDMSIVRDIHKKPKNQQMLENIIDFAKPNHIKVLAEGVETSEELAVCIQCGVDMIQGYYLGKPSFELQEVPAEIKQEISKLLNEN